MANFKFVLTTWMDTTNPSDGLQITPTFSHFGASPDLEAMANDLLDAWDLWMGGTVKGTQQRVAVYEIGAPKPNYPKALVTRFQDVAKPAPVNRDVALCLTGYHNNNRPRFRGRLYIPVCLTGFQTSAATATSQVRDKVGALAGIFGDLGGLNVDWGVYSLVDNTFRKYTHWYVDDAWDTQRRRGRRATARTTGTTGE